MKGKTKYYRHAICKKKKKKYAFNTLWVCSWLIAGGGTGQRQCGCMPIRSEWGGKVLPGNHTREQIGGQNRCGHSKHSDPKYFKLPRKVPSLFSGAQGSWDSCCRGPCFPTPSWLMATWDSSTKFGLNAELYLAAIWKGSPGHWPC